MKQVFIAHPLSADTPEGIKANLDRAVRWYKWCCDQYPQLSFEATWMLNCMVYDDADPHARQAGIHRALETLVRCDELWLVGGEVTEGMANEIELMHCMKRPVFDLTMLGPEPPNGPLSEAELS